MEICYRGAKYNYNPRILDTARIQTIQTKFLCRVCQKETIALAIGDKKTRFLGQVCYTKFYITS